MAPSTIDKMIVNIGYKNAADCIIKYVLPLLTLVLFFFFITLFIFNNLPIAIPYLILGTGIGAIVLYPYIQFERKKTDINQNIHLFITYAGTIATIDINRHLLFKKVAEKKTLGEIANIAEKVEYFARRWNLGFAKTCRQMAKLIPSKIFADFLDRLAVMLDFGESLDTFLNDEQIAVMDDYAANYKKSLENIKTLQEVFMSLTMALGFLVSIGLIIPLITSISMETVVRYALLIIFILDFIVLVFVYTFIPSDRLFQQSEIVDNGMRRIHKWIFICFPISFFLLIFLFMFNFFPFLTNVAIGITPLFAIGLIAQNVENDIFTKDKAYPAFIRSLGSAIEIKGGAIISALRSLQVHDFGPLNQMAEDLHRRLRTGNNKYQSWKFFSAESGSNLIYQFTQIFSEAVFLGGAPERIGEIVSENFNRLLSLRKLKLQLASSLRGALYGSLIGFSAAAYISAQISTMLGGLFSEPFQAISGGNSILGSMVEGIAPNGTLIINMDTVMLYIGAMVIVHAIVSALIIKIVDGGTIYAAFFDMVVMIWIGALIGWLLPLGVGYFLPGLNGAINSASGGALDMAEPAIEGAVVALLPWLLQNNFRKPKHHAKKTQKRTNNAKASVL